MLPINPSQIPGLYAEALRLQNAGKAEEALKRYSTILNAKRDIPEVHFQIGRIFLSAGRLEQASKHLAIAAGLKPTEPAIWSVYSEAVLANPDDAPAQQFLAAATAAKAPASLIEKVRDKLAPAKARSKVTIGQARKDEIERLAALLNAGNLTEAEALGIALHKKHPKVALIADMLAAAQVQLGKTDEAEKSFRKAIALDPKYAEAHGNYARLLILLGRDEEAEAEIRKSLRLAPGQVLAHQNLAQLLLKKGDLDGALASVRKALKLDAKSLEALKLLGTILNRRKEDEESVQAFEMALKIGGPNAEILAALGQSQTALGHEDQALESYNRALELAPENAIYHSRRGVLLQRMGEFDAAEVSLRRSIELDPKTGETYRYLMTSKKLAADDPLVAQMERIFDEEDTGRTDRRNLGFALSKVMEDTKQYSRVFHFLDTANGLMREEYPYDIALRRREVDGIKGMFDTVDLHAQRIEGCTDYAPIFVTGMPRSGTTLVEQIIASHSRITGAGEIGFAARESYRVLVDDKTNNFRRWNQITPKAIAGLGRLYESHMRDRFPEAGQLTDKSIQTYAYMGLIKLALPKSRIIVVRRDPRDNLLSIYKNLFFEGTHLYAYNLRDLGLYYRMFVELIEFWRERIPDWFYEVQYEDLVANPEQEARKLIDACGLEWEDACLNFHENKRRVDTLSVYQVRQPIYASSTKAWQRYEADIAEMIEALGPEAKDGA